MTIAILTTGGTFDKVYFDANSEYSIGEPCISSILDEGNVTSDYRVKSTSVDTPMTSEFDKGLLWTQPEKVAHNIDRAIENGAHTIYAPFYWRYIMITILAIPERIFIRLKL